MPPFACGARFKSQTEPKVQPDEQTAGIARSTGRTNGVTVQGRSQWSICPGYSEQNRNASHGTNRDPDEKYQLSNRGIGPDAAEFRHCDWKVDDEVERHCESQTGNSSIAFLNDDDS